MGHQKVTLKYPPNRAAGRFRAWHFTDRSHGTKYERLLWQLKRPSVGLHNGATLQVYLDGSLSNAIQERGLKHHDGAFASKLLKKLKDFLEQGMESTQCSFRQEQAFGVEPDNAAVRDARPLLILFLLL